MIDQENRIEHDLKTARKFLRAMQRDLVVSKEATS
jgi:hypothetical protein